LVQNMATTLVVVCGKCGGFLLAKADQKTKACPYCGFTIMIEKAKKVASAQTANEASLILRKLKSDNANKRQNVSRASSL